MATVGFIGSGHIGGTVARLAVAAGYHVLLSNSRGPQTLEELASEVGPLARAATGEQAAGDGDIVVVSIPLRAYESVPAAPLAGKPVIDTCNYYPQRDGQIAELDSGSLTSSGLIQRHLAGAQVVKCFNNILYRHLLSLSRPAGAVDRSFLPIAGDDAGANEQVAAFLAAIGYGAVLAGSLADSWRQEPGTPVYGTPYGSVSDPAGTPAGEAAIHPLADWTDRMSPGTPALWLTQLRRTADRSAAADGVRFKVLSWAVRDDQTWELPLPVSITANAGAWINQAADQSGRLRSRTSPPRGRAKPRRLCHGYLLGVMRPICWATI